MTDAELDAPAISELEGDDFSRAIALADGHYIRHDGMVHLNDGSSLAIALDDYAPWENWIYGGRIIEREKIMLANPGWGHNTGSWWALVDAWLDYDYPKPARDGWDGYGDTPLIAAMRAFLHSRVATTQPAACPDCGQTTGHYDDCPIGMGVLPP